MDSQMWRLIQSVKVKNTKVGELHILLTQIQMLKFDPQLNS